VTGKWYAQLWAAIGGTVVMFAFSLFNDEDGLTSLDGVKIANMAVGAYLVWQTTNGPIGSGLWQYAKTVAMGTQAGLVLLVSFWTDGISGTEWVQIGIAVLTAAGVLVLPGSRLISNSPSSEARTSRVLSNALG
jgi:hypothetical protein